jgi:phosphatidate cytidylyltransferase
LIIIPLAAGILFLPLYGLAAIFTAMVFIGAWEWATLSGIASLYAKALYALVVMALLAVAAFYSQLLGTDPDFELVKDVLGIGCFWWAVAFLWVKTYPASAVIWGSVVARLLMGLLVLVPAWVAMVYLRLHRNGEVLIFILIAIVTAADIGAYFMGKAFGDAKLAPKVSPGKSWAGFWGGLATSSGLVLLVWIISTNTKYPLLSVIAIAIVTSLASVLGDLLESMVKRQRGIKDSGSILPGHGGVLDRIDSITAAAPVFALSLLLVGW